ncbi:MAG TPA: alpha/beta hydrolase, partial [Stellaceae bacterium]|nr:alpha/beta hydrolase [Stellaceae bacterium]
GIAITGESENEEWAEDLHELLRKIDASPAYIGGSSSGCRLALILALRHPEAVRGLLLWRVTGGQHAAVHLANQYYTSHIEAAKSGGMAAVCQLDHWKEVIGYNSASRDVLMAMNPADFISRMERWRDSFNAGSEHPVIGLSPAELRSLTMPTCIAPGKDPVHPPPAGEACHRLMPKAEYHEVVTELKATLDEAFVDWDAKEGLLAATFIDFLRRQPR